MVACLVMAAISLSPAGIIRGEQQHPPAASGETTTDFTLKIHQHGAASSDMTHEGRHEGNVGVDERLGEFIDLELTFQDQDGRVLRLGDFIKKPTVILPVFFYCPQACSMMLASLASAINDVPLTPGADYQILALSFDAEETPALAKKAQKNYWPLIQKKFPEDQWLFLTGKQGQIDALLQRLGYRLKKTGPHAFIHPNVLIVISPKGKIIRYLYGIYFLPFDIGMALTEALKGTPQLSIRRVLTYCFDYDSEKRTYVFNAFRIIAVGIILVLSVFLFFLLRRGNRQHAAPEPHERGANHEQA
jgi:protein SCO1/2